MPAQSGTFRPEHGQAEPVQAGTTQRAAEEPGTAGEGGIVTRDARTPSGSVVEPAPVPSTVAEPGTGSQAPGAIEPDAASVAVVEPSPTVAEPSLTVAEPSPTVAAPAPSHRFQVLRRNDGNVVELVTFEGRPGRIDGGAAHFELEGSHWHDGGYDGAPVSVEPVTRIEPGFRQDADAPPDPAMTGLLVRDNATGHWSVVPHAAVEPPRPGEPEGYSVISPVPQESILQPARPGADPLWTARIEGDGTLRLEEYHPGGPARVWRNESGELVMATKPDAPGTKLSFEPWTGDRKSVV